MDGISLYLYFRQNKGLDAQQSQSKRSLTSCLLKLGACCTLSLASPQTIVIIDDMFIENLNQADLTLKTGQNANESTEKTEDRATLLGLARSCESLLPPDNL